MRTELTWTCHACGETRPDDKVAVFTRVHPVADSGATMSENIRFCSDRPACESRARNISLLGEPGMEHPANWHVVRAPAPRPLSLTERIRKRWFGG